MKLTGVLQGAVFCTLVLTVYSLEGKPRRRRCHCKKYIEKINRDVDKRLKEFENRFEKYMYLQTRSDISRDLKSNSNKTFAIDNKLDSLDTSMNKTKEALNRESYNLRIVQENLYSQEVTLDNLNTNFKTLEDIVKSLSVVVDKLEETMSSGITGHSPEALMADKTAAPRGWSSQPPKKIPKGTL